MDNREYYLSLPHDMSGSMSKNRFRMELLWGISKMLKEDANTTQDKTAAQNLNIINKWSLSILKLLQIGKRDLSMRKKRFYISMKAEEYLEQIIKL